MKILLAYQSGLSHRSDPYINLVPTGLCYLHASFQEKGYDSILANFSAWPASRIKRELLALKPDFIGISQWTHNRHISMELAGICRKLLPKSTIVMGGAHATFCYEDILRAGSPVDIVALGEAESTLLELVASEGEVSQWQNVPGVAFRQHNQVVLTSSRNSLANLDCLPLPARYLDKSIGLDLELQAEFIVTSRGCPSTCYFCSSPEFWGRKVRFRSAAAIVEEILYIQQKYGLIYFSIRDDTFTADRKRVVDFCTLLQKQEVNILWNCQSRVTAIDEELIIHMKRAGCECIQLGIESGSPNILRKLGKNITPAQIEQACAIITKVGINLSIFLISDVPGETADDIRQTIELVRHIHPDDGYVSPLAYYPGTQLYKEALAAGCATPGIFSDTRKNAIYAAATPGPASALLLKELTNNNQTDNDRFKRQKQLLGYCFTTNVIAGEWYRQRGEYGRAEQEFIEITKRQPNNPWGWLLLGDHYTNEGKVKSGKECYAKVVNIVPRHSSSQAA